MKKNILVILLSAALLTGCELDLGFFKIGGDQPKETETEQKQEQNNQNSQENQGENGNNENHEGGEQGGNGQQHEQSGDVYTATVNTSGSAISTVAVSSGVSIDSSLASGYKKADALRDALKAQLQYESCLASINCLTLSTAVWNGDCIIQIGTGNPASDKFNSGTFTWNSSAKIYKVEIIAQCYSKDEGATDSLAHLEVDGEDHSLELGTNEEPEFKTISKDYTEGTKSFSLVSVGGRVFLKALKITWRF